LTFLPELHTDRPRYRKMEFIGDFAKTPTFSPPFCAFLTQSAKNLTRKFRVRPTYA